MNCREAERRLAGYLDGAISSRERFSVRQHLDSCAPCREELERYCRLAGYLANIEPVAVPDDLALKIRVQASQAGPRGARLARLQTRFSQWFEEILEPMALPATGGILTALVVFVFLVQNILVGLPLTGVVPNDLPLNLVQPASLVSVAPFPLPGIAGADGAPNSGALLLEATLNAEGEVVFYKILAGPSDKVVTRQIDQVLMFSRFRPQLSFGRPTDGGRVLLNFSEVRVHG
jgi:anti-sigma factor RsiW